MPRLAHGIRQVDEHMLDLRVLFQAVDGKVFAEPALLESAVRHLAHDREMLVDLDRAKSKRVRDAMRTLHVLRPDGGIEAVDDVDRWSGSPMRTVLSRSTNLSWNFL